MNISIAGIPTTQQPDTLTWTPPPLLGYNGNGAPVYGPYWECNLSFSRLADSQFDHWWDAADGDSHAVRLPRPYDGIMTSYTCYVHILSPRMDVRAKDESATSGLDLLLTKVEVT